MTSALVFLYILLALVSGKGLLPQLAPAPVAVFNINCTDKLDNCHSFGLESCKDPYKEWANDYCKQYCGFCIGPTTPPPPCEDKISDCHSYGASVCSDDKYAMWVQDNCRYFCRNCSGPQLTIADSKTTTISIEKCVDKVECKNYGKTACTQYEDWARDNCMNYCGFCRGPPTIAPPCIDKIQNCAAYPHSSCTNSTFRPWAEANCRKHCKFCVSTGPTTPRPPCEDRLPNCQSYGAKVCSDPDYIDWAQENCLYFCRNCSAHDLMIADSKTTTTTLPTTPPPPCEDKLSDCLRYGADVCSNPDYIDWVQENCRYFCRKCSAHDLMIADSKTTTTTIAPTRPTTPTPSCEDKITDCHSFGANVCTDPNYTYWVLQNCRYFCRNCSALDLMIADSKTTTIAPENCVDKIECAKYGKKACVDFKDWASDNCMNYCKFCNGTPTPAPPCRDKVPNCAAYSPSMCTNSTVRPWAETNCRKHCKFCVSSGGSVPSLHQPIPVTNSMRVPTPMVPSVDRQKLFGRHTRK